MILGIFGEANSLRQLIESFRPSKAELRIHTYDNDHTFFRKHRDAWVLEGRIRARTTNGVRGRIREINLADLTFTRSGPLLALESDNRVPLDLSKLNYSDQNVDSLAPGRLFPSTISDRQSLPKDDMQYQVRYHFDRSDTLDTIADKFDRFEATIEFVFDDFRKTVTIEGPITVFEHVDSPRMSDLIPEWSS